MPRDLECWKFAGDTVIPGVGYYKLWLDLTAASGYEQSIPLTAVVRFPN